ncbi:Type II/IV secretion system protein [Magnetospirillum gryphiswaldense MSR-1 v2]|uniref:Type II/IV secretion system protein n=2 Tax=Magnetospirillum gryphiswaldense TaxID=55518 RepID=V6F2B0_MAGGM|nr:CpaF/VirB11 family protein [Magnetospirillum gryphiswaldense]CAM78254.1 type II/IV secretion system protein [Magnetospirillum gryphiswaldense MSR-1]CDK99665.1 Type II/IV secretion system protein [Magnetospirillum gryphiswaldense MSR-1 v2]
MSSAISIILRPLAAYYDDPTTVEMRMTRPKQVIIDRRGHGKIIVAAPELTLARIEDICRSLANFTGVKFDPDTSPKLSCIIPEVRHRFECLVGSSAPYGVSMAIRCKHPFTPTWEQVGASPEIVEYLKSAMAAELNMIISGATNTGKTTFINKLLDFLPEDRRVVALEDTPELHMDRFWDGVALLAAREASTASGMIDWRQLYDHQMRITPDNVIFGEISTQNAFAALGSLNSGITGFMCTIHAASPYQVLHRKFDQNIAWSGQSMPRVPEFLAELVDVIVQIKRSSDGWRRITDIYEPCHDRWVMKDGHFLERNAA